MIATARSKAGMPINMSGEPVKCYTNQSESINDKLTRQKEALAKNKLQIASFDIALPHEEKRLYPDPSDPGRMLPSVRHTTNFYCIKRSCTKPAFRIIFHPFWRFQQSRSPA